jgi:two-component system response regulator (stage 0 sporulation protein A)
MEIYLEKNVDQNTKIDKRLMEILLQIGIPANLQGYQFLKESIKLVIDNPVYINAITKRMYPTVASTFNTTACRVERAIRHALEVAYNKGKMKNINKIFGLKILADNERPTNSEFVALIADRLSLDFC